MLLALLLLGGMWSIFATVPINDLRRPQPGVLPKRESDHRRPADNRQFLGHEYGQEEYAAYADVAN